MHHDVNNSSVILFRQYSFSYRKGSPVLQDISFQMDAGNHTALFGLNGSGKSTLLRSIVGLHRGEGTIQVGGEEVKPGNLKSIRRKVGYLFQDPQVQLFCPTVIEDVAFGPANYHGDEGRARLEAEEALEAVGYRGELFAPCHKLSLGEMRKVALAGVLALNPEVLLLDEPDSFLDSRGKEMLVNILRELDDMTLFLVTHNRDFASALCQRALVLQEGRIGYDGPLEDIPPSAKI